MRYANEKRVLKAIKSMRDAGYESDCTLILGISS